jgi:diaminohydroxyphosphoribosylaminopyrimidine deaminase/5-amino-6-(5-phosphoribosylamino)uracil reductase
MVINHNFYMSLAIQEAWKNIALTYPNPSVGALILDKNGKILAIEATQSSGKSHAELKALESALILMGDEEIEKLNTAHEKHAYLLKYHDRRFEGATLYVTLEPCNHEGKTPACSTLIKSLGFDSVICGMKDPNKIATGGIQRLKDASVHIELDVMKDACKTLLTPFKKWQENKPFIFFKLALTANGVYDGGIITSHTSRTLVHAMRNNIDLLIIGGETVRTDRPTLDSRLVGGKAPDVLILSKQKAFDRTIPLFSIPNRKVFIEDNFDKIDSYHFIMIEGTESLFELSSDMIDWVCLFYAPHMKRGKTLQIEKKLNRLQQLTCGEDTLTWFEKNEGL